MELENKVALITGASSGIGAAAARLFAASGARVVLGARRQGELEAVAGVIRAAGGEAEVLAGDVADAAYAERLVALAQSRFGRLDVAFNNAGTLGAPGPLHLTRTEDWRTTMAVNLDSAFFGAKAQIPALLDSEGPSALIFTGSFVGYTIGLPGMAAYAAAKAGLVGLVQCLAVEHGEAGLRVNALLPGGTLTPMAGDDEDFHARVRGFHALKRMASPQEIAEAALFLASDRSSFVTGHAMLVDGGNSITKA